MVDPVVNKPPQAIYGWVYCRSQAIYWLINGRFHRKSLVMYNPTRSVNCWIYRRNLVSTTQPSLGIVLGGLEGLVLQGIDDQSVYNYW